MLPVTWLQANSGNSTAAAQLLQLQLLSHPYRLFRPGHRNKIIVCLVQAVLVHFTACHTIRLCLRLVAVV